MSKRIMIAAFTTAMSISLVACQTKPGAPSTSDNSPATTDKKGDITVAVYDRGNVPADQGTIDKNWATSWLNEAGPAKAKFVPIPRSTDTAKYNTLFASGDAPDLIWSYDSAFKGQMINQKLVMPIDDMIEKYSTTYKKLLAANPGLKKLSTSADGKMYQIGRLNGLQPNHALYIRTDWLKKLNLPIPQTTEELLNVVKAFAAQDPDGNGKNDTYGIALSGITGQQISYMFGDAGTAVKDGKAVHAWERTSAAFKFRKDVFDANAVDKDYLNDKDGAKAKQAWVNGQLGLYADSISSIAAEQTYAALKKNVPTATVAVIPLPKSPYGQFSPAINPPIQVLGLVNSKAKDPKAVMQYIDFLSEKSTQNKLGFGDKDTDHDLSKDGFPQLKDPNNPKFAWTGDINMLLSSVNYGSRAAYLNSLKPDTNPMDKEWMDLYKQAQDAYLSPDRPWSGITWSEFMPALPTDLQTINAGTTAIGDYFAKAVVSGSSYTVEQALKDAQDLWEKSGGKQIDEWWSKWYDENKNTAFLTKDLYSK